MLSSLQRQDPPRDAESLAPHPQRAEAETRPPPPPPPAVGDVAGHGARLRACPWLSDNAPFKLELVRPAARRSAVPDLPPGRVPGWGRTQVRCLMLPAAVSDGSPQVLLTSSACSHRTASVVGVGMRVREQDAGSPGGSVRHADTHGPQSSRRSDVTMGGFSSGRKQGPRYCGP